MSGWVGPASQPASQRLPSRSRRSHGQPEGRCATVGTRVARASQNDRTKDHLSRVETKQIAVQHARRRGVCFLRKGRKVGVREFSTQRNQVLVSKYC